MTGHQTWTADQLGAWVRQMLGDYAPAWLTWCTDMREKGYTIAAYYCPAGGQAFLSAVKYDAPHDLLPFTDGCGTAWPMDLAGVCYPPGMVNVIPLPASWHGR